jgi:hypothetical protein
MVILLPKIFSMNVQGVEVLYRACLMIVYAALVETFALISMQGGFLSKMMMT